MKFDWLIAGSYDTIRGTFFNFFKYWKNLSCSIFRDFDTGQTISEHYKRTKQCEGLEEKSFLFENDDAI